MRFEKLDQEKIKITLTPQDMSILQITYRQMDYDDQQTRSVLQKLLELAHQKTGFSCPDHARLLIELFPTALGGCSVTFTILSPLQEDGCQVFSFSQLDTLVKAAAKAVKQGCCPGLGCAGANTGKCCCSLYRLEGEYRIVCRSMEISAPCRGILAEYGRPAGSGELAAAYAAEHGKLLATPDALARLAAYLQ